MLDFVTSDLPGVRVCRSSFPSLLLPVCVFPAGLWSRVCCALQHASIISQCGRLPRGKNPPHHGGRSGLITSLTLARFFWLCVCVCERERERERGRGREREREREREAGGGERETDWTLSRKDKLGLDTNAGRAIYPRYSYSTTKRYRGNKPYSEMIIIINKRTREVVRDEIQNYKTGAKWS